MPHLRTEKAAEGGILRLIVDREKGNIYSRAVMLELEQAVKTAAGDADIKLITLEGAGKHFSFGAAVEEHTKEQIAEMLPVLSRLFLTIADSPIPVAALVQGCCFGGAFEVVLAAHLVFAAPDARMAVPEIKLGVFPPVACAVLPRKFGQAVADRMVITGDELSGEELHRLGLVHRCFPADSLFEGVLEWYGKTLGGYSASSLRHCTMASRQPLLRRLRGRLEEMEAAYLNGLMETHDANEGIAAFMEKRAPQWRNQ